VDAIRICDSFFSFAYGGEVPQIPLTVARFLVSICNPLVGITSAQLDLCGALGSWIGAEVSISDAVIFPRFPYCSSVWFSCTTNSSDVKKIKTLV